MPVTAQALILASLLIAPGLIAVLIGTSLGVVEREIRPYQLYGAAFVSSLIIDIIFVWFVQVREMQITNRSALENVFFTESGFQVIAAVGLFTIATIVGIMYLLGYILIYLISAVDCLDVSLLAAEIHGNHGKER
jgi:hypothetical protein